MSILRLKRSGSDTSEPRGLTRRYPWLARFKESYPRLAKPFVTVWGMIRSGGITKRWLLNTFIVVISLMLIAVVALTLMLRSYYYNAIEQGLSQRSSVTINYFRSTLSSGVNSGSSDEYFDAAQAFVEVFDSRDKMELQFINAAGEIIVSSTGFAYEDESLIGDYSLAVDSSKGYGAWAGRNSNGEHVLAVTRLISAKLGPSAGAVRYVVSLEEVDSVLVTLTLILIGVIILIIFLMMLSGSYFVNSIVVPVKQIAESANQIAHGDFDIRLESAYDDEIGALVSTINSMASELASTEKLKNDFISTVSHELRTPLTAIKGWGETLRDCGADDSEIFDKGMGIIVSESERMCSLVEELLDFSAVSSGRMRMVKTELELSGEAELAADLFTERCEQEHKRLTFHRPDELFYISGDPSRLRQVFVNIIDNAVKYSEAGDSIDISLARAGERVQVIVSDTGCGISETELKLVSKRFYKANMTKRGFGIGLGLAEEITRLHDGTLRLESEVGKGTTVYIELPLSARH